MLHQNVKDGFQCILEKSPYKREALSEAPRVSAKIQQRRLRLAGHCARHQEEVASDLVLWQPLEGRTNRGRKRTTYIDTLLQDTGLANVAELKTCIMDRNIWKEYVEAGVRSGDRPR